MFEGTAVHSPGISDSGWEYKNENGCPMPCTALGTNL